MDYKWAHLKNYRKKIPSFSLGEGSNWDSVYYFSNEPYYMSSAGHEDERFEDIKASYYYRYDENKNVKSIEMSIVAELSDIQEGIYIGN